MIIDISTFARGKGSLLIKYCIENGCRESEHREVFKYAKCPRRNKKDCFERRVGDSSQ